MTTLLKEKIPAGEMRLSRANDLKRAYWDDGINKYFYDWRNRLVKITMSSDTNKVVAQYSYNALNYRISKKVDTDSDGAVDYQTIFQYNNKWQVIEESEGDVGGTLSAGRSYTYGAYIDEPITVTTPAHGTLYYTRNQQYSITSLLDANGDIKEAYTYSPYGKQEVRTSAGADGDWFTADDATAQASSIQPYGYTGRRYDAESGLWYFRNRMYSSVMGRFLSTDSLGEWEEVILTNQADQESNTIMNDSSCGNGCSADEKVSNPNLKISIEKLYQDYKRHDIKYIFPPMQQKYADSFNLYENAFLINSTDPYGKIAPLVVAGAVAVGFAGNLIVNAIACLYEIEALNNTKNYCLQKHPNCPEKYMKCVKDYWDREGGKNIAEMCGSVAVGAYAP